MGERVWAGLIKQARRSRVRLYGRSLLCMVFGLLVYSAGAAAQYAAPTEGSTAPGPAGVSLAPTWIFTPSITIGETFTDNVGLVSGGTQADLITSVSPSLAVTGNTARVKLALTYDPQLLVFALSGQSPTLQQQLQGTGKVEVYPELIFLDGSASISQGYVSNTGAVANTTLTTNNNLQPIEAVSLSPYIVHHLGSYVDTESRYRFDAISTGASGIGTQYVNQLNETLTSGDFFGVLKWTATSDYTKTSGLTATGGTTGGASSIDKLYKFDVQYPIFSRVSATGEIGWEHLTDPTLTIQPNGLIWNVGLRYDPSPFASVDFSYGREYGTSDFQFGARYDIGPQTRLHASYTRSIQTGQTLIASGLIQAVPGPNGILINPKTGLPFVPGTGPFGPGGSPFGLTAGSFLDKSFQLDLTLTRGRTTYSVTAFDDQQSAQVANSNQQVISGTLSWTRQLWPNLSGSASATYSNISFRDGSGRVDTYYSLYAGLSYTLSRTASAQLSFSRSARLSNQPGNSLVDDLIAVSMQKQF